MISEGRSINITLIFSLERYAEVIEAYLSGLEACDGDLAPVHSVASFFVSRVDTEVDRRLEATSAPTRRWRCGARPPWPRPSSRTSCSASASRASAGTRSATGAPRCSGRCGRRPRPRTPTTPTRSTSTTSSGPTRSTPCPSATIEAFEDHGTIARTIDDGVDEAAQVMDRRSAAVGVDMGDVGRVLEEEGVASFAKSFDELIETLDEKAAELRPSSEVLTRLHADERPNPLAEAVGDKVAPPAVLVVFGASGDLTSRKLMPAVERLALRRLLPAGFSVVGVARTEMSDDDFRERMRRHGREAAAAGGDEAEPVWDGVRRRLPLRRRRLRRPRHLRPPQGGARRARPRAGHGRQPALLPGHAARPRSR